MWSDKAEILGSQLFRRIGYTNGLHDLFGFTDICRLVGPGIPVLEPEALRRVRTHLGVEEAEARGKLDVAESFGLLVRVGGRCSLSPLGRAALALATKAGDRSTVMKAFYLRRVAVCDADYSFTLLLCIGATEDKVGTDEFAGAIDRLLETKRKKVEESPAPLNLRKLAEQRLVIQWRKADKTPAERNRRRRALVGRPFKYVEIEGTSLATWVRHTITPRRGWLVDLGLEERTESGVLGSTEAGQRIVNFLGKNAEVGRGFVVIDVEPEALRSFSHLDHLFWSSPMAGAFWDEMTATTATSAPLSREQLRPGEFLDRLWEAYEATRLETFQQASIHGVSETVCLPFLVSGRILDFRTQLAEVVKLYPGKISTLGSPLEQVAYLSMRR